MRFRILAAAGAILVAWGSEGAVIHGPVTNAANGHVYYLLGANSWTASEAAAVQLGGHLATVNDATESLWLRDTFGEFGGEDRALWIGLNEARLEGTFEWASGDPVLFRNWRTTFPVQADPEADYVFIDYPSSIYAGRWRNTRNDNFEQPGLPICGVVEVAPAGEPVLSMTRITGEGAKGEARVDFTGMLLRADTVTGPWVELTNAASPYWVESAQNGEAAYSSFVVPPSGGLLSEGMGVDVREDRLKAGLQTGRGFFRSRGPESIFDRDTVVSLSLEGPFEVYFEEAFAGMPDGIFPPVREKPWFEGEVWLSAPGLERPIDVRVRGNSSLQECPFPKLKFKVSRSDRAGTPFFNAREIKVGTHCAEGGRGTIGRLRDERATWREALVYEVMETVGFVGPRARRAQIEYRDTSPMTGTNAPNGEVGWTISRKAVLLDDVEVVAERLGGRALDDEEITNLTNANFDAQLIADLRLLHALLGNWDWALSLDGENLWNTDVVALPNGTLLPVVGDFDLSSFVTEEVQLSAPWDFHPELPELEREARWDVEVVSKEVPAEVFAAGKERFNSKRVAIEALVASALVDEIGRTNAQKHATAFYAALQATGGVRK
jgi:hypothetical protein